MGKVIAVVNPSGGSRKTTITMNLGVGLAMRGEKVLMVDADLQGNLTAGLGFREVGSFKKDLAGILDKIMRNEKVRTNREFGVLIPVVVGR